MHALHGTVPSLGFQSGVLVAISEWDFHATQLLMMLIRRHRVTYMAYWPAIACSVAFARANLSVESTLHWHNLTLLFRSNDRETLSFPSKPRRDAVRSVRDSVTPGTIYSYIPEPTL